MLLFLWLVVLTVATASACLPRASENRAWEKILPALELHPLSALQVAETHQDETPWHFQLAPDQTYPVNGFDPDGRLATQAAGKAVDGLMWAGNQIQNVSDGLSQLHFSLPGIGGSDAQEQFGQTVDDIKAIPLAANNLLDNVHIPAPGIGGPDAQEEFSNYVNGHTVALAATTLLPELAKFPPADAALAPAGGQIVLHQDQIIMNNYQRYYNDAWLKTVQRFNAGDITIPAGQSWQTVLGQVTDAAARDRLRNFLTSAAIPEGPGTDVLVNRWLRDPSGSGAYRIPDVRLLQTQTILDGTIGSKTMNSPQILDFIRYSGGSQAIIVRPTVGPTP